MQAVDDEGCSLATWVAIGPGAITFTRDCGGRRQARSGETGRRNPVCRFCQAVLRKHAVIKSESICGCQGHASSGASSVRMPRPAYGLHVTNRKWAKCWAIPAPVRREVEGVGDGGQRSSSQTCEHSLIDKTLPEAVIAKGEYKRAHTTVELRNTCPSGSHDVA